MVDRSMNRLVDDTTNVSQIGNNIFAPEYHKKEKRQNRSKNPLKRLKARMPKKGQAHID